MLGKACGSILIVILIIIYYFLLLLPLFNNNNNNNSMNNNQQEIFDNSLEEQGLQGMIAGKMNTLRSQLLDQGLVSRLVII